MGRILLRGILPGGLAEVRAIIISHNILICAGYEMSLIICKPHHEASR